MIDLPEISALKRRAIRIAAFNLFIGIGAMLFSLTEQSVGWTFFVWLAGLEGISIGLLAGIGYSQVKLELIPQDWKMSPIAGFFWVVLTYWAPITVTFLFGLMLYTTLPDAALPRSKLAGGPNGVGYIQSLVTFFNANGCVWVMVYRVSRKFESEFCTASEADATDVVE